MLLSWRLRRFSHVCAHVIRFRTHHPRPEKNALITFYISVQMCTHTLSAFRVLHPPSALNRSLLDFWTCADISGWQIIPTQIIILIEINHQITKYICKNPPLYYLCLSQYNGAKNTTNTWVSDALELDNEARDETIRSSHDTISIDTKGDDMVIFDTIWYGK